MIQQQILANGITTYMGDDTDGAYPLMAIAEMGIDGSVVAHRAETSNGIWCKCTVVATATMDSVCPFEHNTATTADGTTAIIP